MSVDLAIKPIGQAQPVGGSNADGSHIESKKAGRSAEQKRDVDPAEVASAATDVQTLLKRLNTELKIEVNKDSRDVVVKIIDPETRTVIRQIPSDEILSIRERMTRFIGVLFKTKT